MSLESWSTGTVIRIEDETYNTKRFFIRVNEVDSFNFKAGQFVTLDLPIHEQKNKRWRSYSIASWPDGTNVYELVIVLLEGGAGSTYLFNEVKVGSELMFRGALGNFILPDNIEKDIFFICTGTGIAPFRSMLNDVKLHHISHKNLYLVYGCRTQKDLLYYDEMKELENEISNFYYLPTLSREKWNGHTGYVHDLYEEICKRNNEACENISNLKPAGFYLCGWKFMIDDARKKIAELGYDRKCIHLESYG
ncbi:MAG TPA: FAD-binding oxidoreductase [Hanamia sp.]|jgi:glycine betaine catabolism B|nr:FAD-binding oxidoreductase [Hanamia sp.]